MVAGWGEKTPGLWRKVGRECLGDARAWVAASRLHLELRATLLGPVDVEELAARFVGPLVGVRTEEVALTLEQIGRQTR